ncbi:hypothetical protein B0H12DRAFT_309448 [Mycena haematopus]|nr:hypothetical protein B0H12DRAFT_309448 [Mycena haematopus]
MPAGWTSRVDLKHDISPKALCTPNSCVSRSGVRDARAPPQTIPRHMSIVVGAHARTLEGGTICTSTSVCARTVCARLALVRKESWRDGARTYTRCGGARAGDALPQVRARVRGTRGVGALDVCRRGQSAARRPQGAADLDLMRR